MAVFSLLPPAEQARQLANPEGPVGIEVAEWLNGHNRESSSQTLAMLGLHAGCQLLEIGFGNGRVASDKTEVIRHRGPWRTFEALEYATLEWVDWFNHRRLLTSIGNIPPAELESTFDASTRARLS